MSDVVPYDPSVDFSGLRLEKTKNGNVVSPFFSFDYSAELKRGLYNWNSRYHSITGSAKSAFANFLGINVSEVLVTEKRDKEGEIWWRLGTQHPCEIPKPYVKVVHQKKSISIDTRAQHQTLKDAGPPAIDI
jgi:hypothetical protein